MSEPLLDLDLTSGYPQKPDVLHRLRLAIEPGEIVGLAGGSGEGKSTLILSILGLLGLKGGTCRGRVSFLGRDLLPMNQSELRAYRGKSIGLVPQSPVSALNPHLRLRAHLDEAWRAHERGRTEYKTLLESVGLPSDDSFLRLYPRNLSVGMAQRFLIAMAILHHPPLLLADEPTSALDLLTQSEILALFRRLNRERNIAILFVSHDLAAMASLCHRVAVIHQGEIVENAPVDQLLSAPQHPWTRRLIDAIPETTTRLVRL